MNDRLRASLGLAAIADFMAWLHILKSARRALHTGFGGYSYCACKKREENGDSRKPYHRGRRVLVWQVKSMYEWADGACLNIAIRLAVVIKHPENNTKIYILAVPDIKQTRFQ